jgi:molecular chaperone DnaK (HSP70)
VNVSRTLKRAELDAVTAPLVERLAGPCRQALADARVEPGAVNHLLLVGGMTRVPAVQRRLAEIFKCKQSRGVNPDEAVALGAALEIGILEGKLGDVVVVDVASHTIGLRAGGDRFVPVVKRSTSIPARTSKVFSTTEDNQQHVNIEVYQGEDPVASKNRLLSRLRLGDLPKGAKGEVHIEVTFALDVSGLLAVTARDMTSGRMAKVDVVGGTGLGRAEVARLAEERQQLRR